MPPKRKSRPGGKGLRNTWSSGDNSKTSTSKSLRNGKKIKSGTLNYKVNLFYVRNYNSQSPNIFAYCFSKQK